MTPPLQQLAFALLLSFAVHGALAWHLFGDPPPRAAQTVEHDAILVALGPPSAKAKRLKPDALRPQATGSTQRTEPVELQVDTVRAPMPAARPTPRDTVPEQVVNETLVEDHVLALAMPPPSQRIKPTRQDVPDPVRVEPATRAPNKKANELTLPTLETQRAAAQPSKPTLGQLKPQRAEPRLGKAEADYTARVRARIAEARSYPLLARRQRLEGAVAISFVIDQQGNVDRVTVDQSCGHAILDRATEKLIERVAPYPKPPSAPFHASVTLRYTLN